MKKHLQGFFVPIKWLIAWKMHKMHNNSAVYRHVAMMENTFFAFFDLFVALLKIIYYNEQYIFNRVNKSTNKGWSM
jgi:hypothetical protein